jgi:hypothetical protein
MIQVVHPGEPTNGDEPTRGQRADSGGALGNAATIINAGVAAGSYEAIDAERAKVHAQPCDANMARSVI